MQYCPAKAGKISEIVLHIQIPGLASMQLFDTELINVERCY